MSVSGQGKKLSRGQWWIRGLVWSAFVVVLTVRFCFSTGAR